MYWSLFRRYLLAEGMIEGNCITVTGLKRKPLLSNTMTAIFNIMNSLLHAHKHKRTHTHTYTHTHSHTHTHTHTGKTLGENVEGLKGSILVTLLHHSCHFLNNPATL
jgi:hypothetical protein